MIARATLLAMIVLATACELDVDLSPEPDAAVLPDAPAIEDSARPDAIEPVDAPSVD